MTEEGYRNNSIFSKQNIFRIAIREIRRSGLVRGRKDIGWETFMNITLEEVAAVVMLLADF